MCGGIRILFYRCEPNILITVEYLILRLFNVLMITYPTGGSREQHYPSDPAKPLVSIVIVTLNAEACLRTCLLSIINQQYKNIELLVFDGLSGDSTLKIIKEYDTHISYWQSSPDQGIYDAMNKAIQKASGDWIYFIGADDKLLKGFSQMCMRLVNPYSIYYGDMAYNGKATSRKEYTTYRLSKETICHQAILYPKKAFKKYNYNLRYPLAADWVLNIQLWSDKQFSFQFFPYVIADFSLAGASSSAIDVNFYLDQSKLIKRNLGFTTYVRFLVKKLRNKLSHNI